jgi:hypothetical protein
MGFKTDINALASVIKSGASGLVVACGSPLNDE